MTESFRDLGVHDALCDALETRGITYPFPIQERSLPLALTGQDIIGQARTGTGKTLAFGLPLLQRLDPTVARTQALVIVPTRELCIQVADELSIGAALGLTSIAIYGGVPYDDQVAAVTGGVHVVVGTPGRLLDLFQRRDLDLSEVRQLVLDEADEMLDMGFLPDVERLIEACSPERHSMLFSATMPTAVVKMARRYLSNPTFVRADHEVINTAPLVTQHFLQVHRLDKPRILARILQSPGRGGVYVFVRTKSKADRLVEELEELGVEAIAIHGDLRQTTREKNLDRFRDGRATVLVATEVAARGLDVDGVTHVINFDCPEDEKMYLHRIGRTARAGQAGVAITFAEHNELERLQMIRKAVEQTSNDVVEVFSTSDELTERFDLPEETPWGRIAAARPSRPSRPSAPRTDETSSRNASSTPGGRTRRPRGATPAAERSERPTRGPVDAPVDAPVEVPIEAPVAAETAGDGPARRSRASASAKDDGAEPTATRTRVRTRTRAASSEGEPTPSADEAPAAPRTRARRPRAGEGTSRTTVHDAADAASPDAPRADGEGRRSDRRRRDARRGEGERTRRTEGSEDAGGRSGGRGNGRATTGKGSSTGQGAAAKGRAKGQGASSGTGAAKESRQGGGKERRTSRTAPIDAPAARGEGQPQLARRVKVEHLP